MSTQQLTDVSGPAATGAGAGLTLLSWINTWDWGFLVGVVIGLVGLAISYANYRTNKQFQKRKDQREQAEEDRKKEIHRLEMKKLEGLCNAKQD